MKAMETTREIPGILYAHPLLFVVIRSFHPRHNPKNTSSNDKNAYNINMAHEIEKSKRPRVVWLNVNGLTGSLVSELLEDRKLPNFTSIFSDSVKIINVTGIFPPRSVPSMASLLTGCHPSHHGLPDNAFFDRYGKLPKFRSYLEELSPLPFRGFRPFKTSSAIIPSSRADTLANIDLSGATRTIFEELALKKIRAASAFSIFSRGARDIIKPSPTNILQYFAGQKGYINLSHYDHLLFKHVFNYILDCRKLPRLLFLNAPGFEMAMRAPKPQNSYHLVSGSLDSLFGKLLSTISQRYSTDMFTFVLSSAYGLSTPPVDSISQISIQTLINFFTQNGYSPSSPCSNEHLKRKDIILTGDDASLHLYIKNAKTANWYDPPRLREDVLKIAVSIMESSVDSGNSPMYGFVDFFIVKDYESKCYLILNDDKLYEISRFFSSHQRPETLSVHLKQITGSFSNKSADLILILKKGFYLSSLGSRPFSKPCVISSRSHSHLPLIFSDTESQLHNSSPSSIVEIKSLLQNLF